MDDFRQRAAAAYGEGAYELKHTEFRGNAVPTAILCPDHGFFTTTPDNFLYNRGCPECRGNHPRGYPSRANRVGRVKRGRPPVEHSVYIHTAGPDFIKVGITSGDVEKRRSQIDAASVYDHATVYVKTFESRAICAGVEKLIKSLYPMDAAPGGAVRDGATEITRAEFLPEIVAILETIPSVSRP